MKVTVVIHSINFKQTEVGECHVGCKRDGNIRHVLLVSEHAD